MKRLVAATVAAVVLGTTSAAAGGSGAAGQSPFSGVYFGMHSGGGWGWGTWDTPNGVAIWAPTAGFPATGLTTGVFGGFHAGYSHDFGPVVVGAEASFNLTNVDGQIECGDGVIYGYICNTALLSYGTLTGRIGHAFGNTQVYVNGGLAWGRHGLQINEPFYAYTFAMPTAHTWGETIETAFGWTAGFGVERYLSHGLSIRADYSYVGFPTREATLTSPTWPDTLAVVSQGYHFASVGLNYRFGMSDDEGYDGMAMGDAADDWDVTVGKRAWLNMPYYRLDLYDTGGTAQVSRLTYSGVVGLAGEAFIEAHSPNRFFVNAQLGTGVGWGGTLVDEDFPPFIVPYTATVSDLMGTRLSYGGVDAGFDVVDRERVRLGFFAGLNATLERYQSFGCTQTQPGSTICVPTVPGDYEIITQTALWGGLRLGVLAEVALTDRLDWRGQAAVEPLLFVGAIDNHWLRPDINPLPEAATGFGVQLETALDYAVTPQLTLGIGGRFWWRRADGVAVFPGSTQAQTTTSRNLGVFFEANYALD